MEIIQQAIEKIKEEMEKEKNPYTTAIGNYVLANIEVNKHSAENIVSGSKTLTGSLEEMKKAAQKVAHNGVGVLTDAEGFEIVSKYFEFEGIQSSVEDVQTKAEVIQFPKNEIDENNAERSQNSFSASLDEFIK